MTVQIWPGGSECNLNCKYCYQPEGNLYPEADVEAIKSKLSEIASGSSDDIPVVLSGGEPLLNSKQLLDDLLGFIYGLFGTSSIQTNGILLDDEHLEMFKKYDTSVGVSIDGPGELNSPRWAGSPSRTERMTQKTIENIHKLVSHSIIPGISLTIHNYNVGTEERFQKLKDFLSYLADLEVKNILFHNGIFFNVQDPGASSEDDSIAVGPQRQAEALLELAEIQFEEQTLNWQPFKDILNRLQGSPRASKCVWGPCDYFSTRPLQSITPRGGIINCPATAHRNVDSLLARDRLNHRPVYLANTAQDKHGCQGCRFFIFCLGHCPAAGVNNDPRNRSHFCFVVKKLFEMYEKKLERRGENPLSRRPINEKIRERMLEEFKRGKRIKLHQVLKSMETEI